MDGVPTAYYYLLAHPDFDRYDLSSLRLCWVGGRRCRRRSPLEFTRRTGCPVHEVWGMTELAGATSANPSTQTTSRERSGCPIRATPSAWSMSRIRRARCRAAQPG
jgi:acyl-coenzyme A synthetase/AMP-(fatty) acid ligase